MKNLPAIGGDTGDRGSIPGLGLSSGGGNNPLQDSCLGNPVDRGSWQATVHGVANSQTQLSRHTLSAVLNVPRGAVGVSGYLPPSGWRLWGGTGKPPGTCSELSEGGPHHGQPRGWGWHGHQESSSSWDFFSSRRGAAVGDLRLHLPLAVRKAGEDAGSWL